MSGNINMSRTGKLRRVLFIIPSLELAGAERMAVDLMTRISRHEYEVGAICLYEGGHPLLLEELASCGVRVWHLGKRPGFDIRMLRRIDKIIRNFQPDIVHTHRYVLPYSILSLILRRVSLVLHTVHNLAEREVSRFVQRIHKVSFSLGVLPVSISKEVSLSIEKLYGIRNVKLIPNGIATEVFDGAAVEKEAWRALEGFGDTDVIYTCVARLSGQKNHDLLIRAFVSHALDFADTHLVLLGEGELRSDLELLVANAGLEHRVHFLGLRTDVAATLQASDVFVLASHYEGNPLSVMEAMASGLPVVATGVGGVPELVDSGVNGIVVQAGDTSAFSDALNRLASDSELRQLMGQRARREAHDRFDVRHMVAAYEDLYATGNEQG